MENDLSAEIFLTSHTFENQIVCHKTLHFKERKINHRSAFAHSLLQKVKMEKKLEK